MKISDQLRIFASAKFIQLHEHKRATLEAADLLDKAEAALEQIINAHREIMADGKWHTISATEVVMRDIATEALAAIRGEGDE